MSNSVDYSAAPPPQQPYAQPERKGLAVAALVLGILAILGCLVPLLNVFSILLGLVGLVLGVVAVRKAKLPMHGGRGMGLAGVVLSAVAIVVAVLVNVAVGAAVNEAASDPGVRAAIETLESTAPSAPAVDEPAEQAPDAAVATGAAPASEPEHSATFDPPAPVEAEPAETTGGSVSERNALRSAQDYLEFSAFSESGLVDQLEFEGFSTEDATYAVEKLEVDWNEQAAKSAEDYLEFSSFSRSGLVDQLEFEGFTPEQAEYGADQTGL